MIAESRKLTRLKGMVDVLPEEAERRAHLAAQLAGCYARAGYLPLETPLLERSELLLRRAGDQLAERLYSFEHRGRQLALRPEFTTGVARAYIEGGMSGTPTRLRYSGPVFLENPGRGRPRQFTQAGFELIGAAGPRADAEALTLAAATMEGLRGWNIEVGHLGLVSILLDQLGLDHQASSLLVANLENLNRPGRSRLYVEERLAPFYGPLSDPPALEAAAGRERISGEAALALFASSNDGAQGEVYERLRIKMGRRQQSGLVGRGLALLDELSKAAGEPFAALAAARAILRAHGLDGRGSVILDELERTFNIAAGGVPLERVRLNLAFGRGLLYYTGILFEVRSPSLPDDAPLGGGGRYDDLIAALDGPPTPACGFACTLERLSAALVSERELPPLRYHLMVVPLGSDDVEAALQLAARLRKMGKRVEMEVVERKLDASLRYADRAKISTVFMIGPDERAGGYVTLRDMSEHTERRIALTRLETVDWVGDTNDE